MEVRDAQEECSVKGRTEKDYLWTGAGEPDPEIQRLERALAKFRHKAEAPVFPPLEPAAPKSSLVAYLRRPRFAFVAAVTAVFGLAILGVLQWRSITGGNAASWDVAQMTGAPRVGRKILKESGKTIGLHAGDTLETDGASRATISATIFGEVDVEPNTRLRVLRTSVGRRHLELERGTIHARIWANPGDFAVDTPSARAIDLGCVYTLHVDDSGAGLLRTAIGWVGFKLGNHEAFIPAGAVCATRPKLGPGTPYFEDAPKALRTALAEFDFADGTAEQRAGKLTIILKEARARDALTLWHLLTRVDAAERDSVYKRLAGFVTPPTGVTTDGILRGDQDMLDSWWSALGYGDISLWRTWERSWVSPGDTRGEKKHTDLTQR